ncbi:MAG: plasmid mobilization relaxosome protein MobC [Bacteroidales bacterium]
MAKQNRNEYLKEYRKQRIHRVIIFTPDQYNLLQKRARKYGKPFSTFVREMALSQASNQYLSHDHKLKEIRLLLIRLGTNTNQLAHVANATFSIPHPGIEDLQKQFKSIHQEIMKVFQKPILVEDVVRNAISKDRNYIQRIETIIKELS